MRFFEFLKLALRFFGVVWPLPDLANSDECRMWLRGVLGLADELAELTTTEMDDEAVAVLLELINDDETWSMIYAFIANLLQEGGEDVSLAGLEGAVRNKVAELKPGIDPATIVAIIMAIIEIIRMFRK